MGSGSWVEIVRLHLIRSQNRRQGNTNIPPISEDSNTFVIMVLSQQQTYRNIHGKRTLDKLGMLFVVL